MDNYSILREFIKAAEKVKDKGSPLAQDIDISGKAFEARFKNEFSKLSGKNKTRVDFFPSKLNDKKIMVERNNKLNPVEKFMVFFDDNKPSHIRAWVNMPRYNVIPTQQELQKTLRF